jgi:hypothetical protein
MGPFGRGRSSINSGALGISAVMLAQLEGPYFSSECTALWFIVEVTSEC